MHMKSLAFVVFALALCVIGPCALADDSAANGSAASQSGSLGVSTSSQNILTDDDPADLPSPSWKQRAINALPPAVSDGLDVNAWGWFSDLQNNQKEYSNSYDAEVSLGVTKSFDQQLTLSAQGNFIDANRTTRGELEQAYASLLLNPDQGSFLTAGKFNANFGVEGRDFWERTTGTTSLLFGAQAQDIVGIMLTEPVGDTGVKVRPFLTEDFQGQFYFNQPPSGGLNLEYQPTHDLTLSMTGMVGPGFVLFGGNPIHSPYPRGDYDDGNSVTANWQGPNLFAESGGTMYFVEATAGWQVRPDLRLSAEFLQENTSTSNGSWGWYGFLAQADYDLTDYLHCFARWSYLNDHDSLVTGDSQIAQEASGGLGYDIFEGLEVRGEYRHDFSSADDGVDSVSVHLTFTY
jgi:hypothetical protein